MPGRERATSRSSFGPLANHPDRADGRIVPSPRPGVKLPSGKADPLWLEDLVSGIILLEPPMTLVHSQTPEPPPGRVLVVRLGAVGDVVRTLPAVRLVKNTWPGVTVGWAVEELSAPLLEGHPDIDRILLLPRRALARAAKGASPAALRLAGGFRREVKGFGADLTLDFQSSFKSGLVAWLSRAPRRFGFDKPFDREHSHLFANRRVRPRSLRQHRVQRAVDLALAAGAHHGPLIADLALTSGELDEGRSRFAALSPRPTTVTLAPFSSRRQSWKRYPLEAWAETIRRLADEGIGTLVLGGPGEREEAEALGRAAPGATTLSTDLPLRRLSSLIAAAPALIGGDTGPMHLAWAVGCRVVAIYGPTDPVLNAPFGEGHRVLAPSEPSRRDDSDRFPGVTPARIVQETREILESLSTEARP